MKTPCGICHKSVKINHRATQCDICQLWIHIKCNDISKTDYQVLQSSEEVWYCKKCLSSVFPFCNQPDHELLNIINCRRPRMPSELELLPSFDLLSKISGLPNLDNSDIDNNLPSPVHSKYCYPSDFENLALSSYQSYFSLFQINLISLDAHFKNLQSTLSLLSIPFQVM